MIASGGMGLVYEAVQESPHRSVALKVMRRTAATPSSLKRFRNEAQLMARLHHPGIAQVYEAGVDETGPEPVPFITMELIPGAKTLRDYVRAKALSREQIVELVAQAADAVAHGNAKGVIHRDLKPSNILVDHAGTLKIVDFGVARTMDADTPVTYQTEPGQLVGTVQYMSPEQITADSRELDARADVYSLGVILYELLSGRLPHDLEGKSVYEAAMVIRDQPSHKLGTVSSDVPLDLETIVHRAVEKDRDRRYATAADLAAI
jgi:serine/threonine protein kinase